MTARREFRCRPCRRGDCEECVRLLWGGEGCVHECFSGRQLSLFPQADVEHQALVQPAPVREPDPDLDW